MSTPTPLSPAPAGEWLGCRLGERTVSWTERDAILYAIAVGAGPQDLDLVFEERLRVLPTFALTLAQWAPDVLGGFGAFEVGRALHGAQHLDVHKPLPATGELTMAASVTAVWDKGTAAVFDVTVESEAFTATWSLFAPGRGGFGGERGPGRTPTPPGDPNWTVRIGTAANQAALYRLLGDRHHIHIDPDAARAIGQPRPILHGLATLGAAALAAADATGAHPADVSRLSGRFSAAVFPGDRLEISGWSAGSFVASTGTGPVIDSGFVEFG